MSHEVIERISIGSGVELARVVRAGRWVFAQGNMATTHSGGVCSTGTDPDGDDTDSLLREPSGLSQGRWTFDSLARNLEKAGLSLEDLVRVDQYYTTAAAVPSYHMARREAFGSSIMPPSTSIVVDRLLTPGAVLCLEALAVEEGGKKRRPISASGIPMPRASSGFVPILKFGELVFLSGQIADAVDGSGIAAEATMNPQFIWDGSEIGRQARYVLNNLLHSAEAAGCDREHIVKAQVYLKNMEDLPEFNEVWKEVFKDAGPVRTVAPASALALQKGIIEINLVGVMSGTKLKRTGGGALPGVSAAITVADLTLLSGVSAAREDGRKLAPVIGAIRKDRYVRSVAAAETEVIIDEVEARLAAHGRKLQDLTRIIQFHIDLDDFLSSAQVWHRRVGGPVPISAVQVHGPLVPSGARILADCWAVA
jgi:enamine deaminase RidA (YjgF/YER057c/UK114 family)